MRLPAALVEFVREPVLLAASASLVDIVRGQNLVHVPDLAATELYHAGNRVRRAYVDLGGARTLISVALRKDDALLGTFNVYRQEVRPFSDKQITLVQNFAAQAVIAIENARLLGELRERTDDLSYSLQQQTATADVLKVISRSTFDLQPVLDTLVSSACRLCEADIGTVRYQDGSTSYRLAAHYGCTPEWRDHFAHQSTKPDRGTIFGRTIVDGRTIHIPDVLNDPEFTRLAAQKLMGFRAALGVPLIREGRVFGVVNLLRFAPRSFTEKQIELVETFADQAVIAIENARLFNEVQAKTRDLEESLQQQTATSQVLQIISSSPSDPAPVFEKILENATRVCGAEFGSMNLIEGDSLRQAALYNAPAAFAAARANKVFRPHPQGLMAAAVRTKKAVQIADVRATAAYLERAPYAVELAELGGARTVVVVPMLREDEVIGSITIYHQEVRPFADKQIELVSNFAKQAVIAIENARLLGELRQRTAYLARSVDELTATSDVLKIISRSTIDLEMVLDTLVETAARLCRADQTQMFRRQDNRYHVVASHGASPEFQEWLSRNPLPTSGRGTATARAATERRTVHIADVMTDPEYEWQEGQRVGAYRTVLAVPLLRGDSEIGLFTLLRARVAPFTDKEIELANTFADQAVIAIENARLFEELRRQHG